MIIYLDVLFCRELIFNLIIIYLTAKISSKLTTVKKLVISDIVGSIIGIIMMYFSLNVNGVFKMCSATIILLIAFKFKSFYEYLKTVITFYIVTFLVGGVVTYAIENNMNIAPYIAFVATFILQLIRSYKRKYQLESYMAELVFDKNSEKIRTLIDTGNSLSTCYDEPVVVISKSLSSKVKLKDVKKGDYRRVCYRTIEHDEVIVDGIKVSNLRLIYKDCVYICNAVVILSDVDFESYDAIIGPNFLEHSEKNKILERNEKDGNFIFN